MEATNSNYFNYLAPITLFNSEKKIIYQLKYALKKGIRLIDYLEKLLPFYLANNASLNNTLNTKFRIIKTTYSIQWEKEIKAGKFKIFYNQKSFFIGKNYLLSDKEKKLKLLYYPKADAPEPKVDLSYQVLYEDNYFYIISKPANLPMHPCGGYFHNTLVAMVNRNTDSQNYYSLNRLDSETSGIVFFIKNRDWINKLTSVFLQAKKFYFALVYGKFPSFEKVALPIGRLDNSLVHKKRGHRKDGKTAITIFKRLKVKDDYSLLLAHPKTGRTHQIRAHLNEIGFPVVGDKIYGKDERYFLDFYDNGLSQSLLNKLELDRHFLHCYKSVFYHPFLNKTISIKSPLPNQLRDFLAKKGFEL